MINSKGCRRYYLPVSKSKNDNYYKARTEPLCSENKSDTDLDSHHYSYFNRISLIS